MLFSRDSLQGPKIEPKKALILLDFQHDFTSPDGKLFVNNVDFILRKLPNLISKFRETDLIVWTRTTFHEPCPTVSPQIGGYQVICKDLAEHMKQHLIDEEMRFAGNTDTIRSPRRRGRPKLHDDEDAFLGAHIPPAKRCCLPNTAGVDLSSQLLSEYVVDQDLMIHKSQYSALADFSIVNRLRARMINQLYICGTLSNAGVYATALDAVQQGFNVTLVEDCLGYRHEACHIEAMRRMADDLGASGIDCQELLDDLYGLLGDVIPAGRYTHSFQLSMQRNSPKNGQSSSQRVNQWMQSIESDQPPVSPLKEREKPRTNSQIREILESTTNQSTTTLSENESSVQPETSPSSLKYPPSRKRSTSEREDTIKSLAQTKKPVQAPPSTTLASDDVEAHKIIKKSRTDPNLSSPTVPEALSSQTYKESSLAKALTGQSRSESHISTLETLKDTSSPSDRTMSDPNISRNTPFKKPALKQKQQKANLESSYLGPESMIGTGDSKVVFNVLPENAANEAFAKLKTEVAWQKMLHRSGEVPRLVAVQGTIAADGSIPIYRHPADESPPLLPFDATVDSLRQVCEKLVGHKLNHVLIQHYRTSEDNISEHSDKTLDIVRGSSIVNLSLGAMRTMTLRSKKAPIQAAAPTGEASVGGLAPSRPTQRIRLPHNSLFILGERTNADWLHAIRADKRPVVEKSEDELAFDGERISLTFRNIGTFVDPGKQLIWGQGATSKDQRNARPILKGIDAEIVGEGMIIGFGRENHLTGADFNWDEVYGGGFDVINLEVTAKET